MATGVPIWQWTLSSVLVPIVIGLGGAWLVHGLSLRATRQQARLVEHRATYERLLPALHDLVLMTERSVRLEMHEFYSQQEEDRERDLDDMWRDRYSKAMGAVHDVIARGELAASKKVVRALDEFLAADQATSDEWKRGTHDFLSIYERDAAAARRARDEIRKAVAAEV